MTDVPVDPLAGPDWMAPSEGVSMSSDRPDVAEGVPQTEEEWRQELSPSQYQVLRKAGTEPPFSGKFVHNHDAGNYRCAGCGAVLFSSGTKFDSGSGWPSFTRPIDPAHVNELPDGTATEVRSTHGDSHLGHVFADGPRDRGGLRYCINSAALRFIHRDDMEAEGYADYLNQVEDVHE